MQQCPTCGSMNPDDAEVCADCGMELPGKNASTGTPAPTPEATAPGAPPTPAPFDFAPEAAPTGTGATPEATSPAGTPAPASDPFSGGEWNFDLNKGAAPSSEGQPTVTPADATMPEAVAPPLNTPTPTPLESAPTAVIEPTPAPLPSTPVATSGTAKLVLKRGGAPTGDVFSIGSSATVGRFDPESGPVDVDLAQLPESVYISRHHAEINLRDGQWQVKDLGSRNGTFVKNASGFTRVTGETPVQNGDEVAFGNARFEFQTS